MGDLKRFLAAFTAVAFAVSSFGTAWAPRTPDHSSLVDPSLRAGEVALVQTTSGHAGALSMKLSSLGATDIETAYAANTVMARLSPEALAAIGTDPSVTVATRDTQIVAQDSDNWGWSSAMTSSAGINAINAPAAWTLTKGAGVTVALMDSGIAQHPDLPAGTVLARADFVGDGTALLDPAGHGTHLAGLVAANGQMRGVAPEARLVSIRVLGANGTGTLTSVVKGFDWLLSNAKKYSIKVLNLSWGAPQATTYHKDLLAGLAESAWFSGITVVASAGNKGASDGSVTMPGADPFIVTVGSFDDQGTVSTSDDRPSTFSSSGTTLDGFTKPDVLAPGHYVVSLRATGVAYPGGVMGDLYVRMSGTSASAAFVSGVAALVRSAHPEYTPTMVKGAIMASGRRIPNTSVRAVDTARALTSMATVNALLAPSRLLTSFLSNSHLIAAGITWEGVTWEGVTWDAVTWESVSWESVSWESVTWESTTWEGATWERLRR